MNESIILRNRKAKDKLLTNLKKRNFEAYYCETKEEALKTALSLIPKDHTVSWGGSASAEEIGLIDAVKKSFNVIDRDTAKTPEEGAELRRKGLLSDTFIMGTNAISEDGQLVNIDCMGNRVAALCFGPKSVIVICGMNKLVKTVEDAYTRAHTIAAPINAQRFPVLGTPCEISGNCADCLCENCICCSVVTTRMCKPKGRIKVILVGENLGF